jgi:hypothetical protein
MDKKRLEEIAAIPDEAIDTSEIPEVDDEWFARAKLRPASSAATLAAENAALRERVRFLEKAFAEVAVALDASIKSEIELRKQLKGNQP